MCILQIGELCKAVSDEMRTEETAVPWKEWCGIRDIFAHQYSNLDIQSAWDTIQNDVLKLQSKAENFKMEVKNRKNCFYSKDDDGLRIDFQFDTEKVKKEKLYDESANVEYEGTLVTDCFVKEIEEIIDKKEFVSVNRIFEIGEKYTMRQIAGNDEPNYIRECGKAWDKLWDYFDVAEYKDIFFPETKKWFLTSQEKDFLKSYFAEVCREGKDDKTGKGYDRTAKREVKSFLDKRKTKLEYDEKEKIEWAARNLYQMIRVRSGITEEIRGKFFKSTIDKLNYIKEKKILMILRMQ